LDHAAVATPQSRRVEIVDPSGRPVAVVAMRLSGLLLDVPVTRIASGPLGPTLARQVIGRIRRAAWENGAEAVRLSDAHAAGFFRDAARAEGYCEQRDGAWASAVLVGRGDATALRARISGVESETGLSFAPLRDRLSQAGDPSSLLDVEYLARPFELTGAEVPCHSIPIKPVWASELLGYPPQLPSRDSLLGLSHEHVYYRSPVGRHPDAPARLLWYVSGGGPSGGSQVVAWSYLVESSKMPTSEAFRRFQRLGVYRWEDVERSANKGEVGVMRFLATRLLARPVPLPRLRRLADNMALELVLRGPSELPVALFDEIVKDDA
jgi:hypothetical protein